MTAEAIVLNKSAVAMAADSAVTISGGLRSVKTYDTVNKLFELVKGRPVGVMIYANAELNGIPWETIIKGYRAERANVRLPYLADYVDDFTQYIKSNTDLFPPETDEFTIRNAVDNALIPIFVYLEENQSRCIKSTGRLVKSQIKQAVQEGLKLAEGDLAAIDESQWAIDGGIDVIKAQCRKHVDSIVRDQFKPFDLSRQILSGLVELALNFITRSVINPGYTGIVLAGFGERDYLPASYSATLRGRIDGHLMSLPGMTFKVTVNQPAHVQTFAQDEEAQAYLSGVNNAVRARIIEFWSSWTQSAKDEALKVAQGIDGLTPEQAEVIADRFFDHAQANVHQFMSEMQAHQDEELLAPIWESVGLLPKDELAVLAESLVNLTSLKQRMSVHQAQTVGGAIDVALISKGDGFIWLRRKHYFTPELNPSWALTHSGILDAPGVRAERGPLSDG